MRVLSEYLESDEDLIEKHVALPATRPDGRALIRLNMISSADGGTVVGGTSGGLGNRNDHAVFAALRARADAVLVGLGTVVPEHYHAPTEPGLQIYVVAEQPDIAGDAELFTSGRATLVMPPDAAPAPKGVPELRFGSGSLVDLPAVSAYLAGKVVLMEGGPSLAGQMVALGLVDEFFHTVSPMVISGESPRVAHGPPGDAHPWALMHGCCDEAGYLFLRYAARMTSTTKGVRTMGRKYHIISGDGHLETPPDFVKYVPEKFKDRAPRLITLPDGGGDAWLMEGMPLTYASQNLKGRGVVKFAGQSYFDDDGARAAGAGDGVQRLQEQDEDGLDAELLFAPVFASRFLEKIPDRDAYMSMVQAYNTWLSDDYCTPAPDRLIGNALIPVSGIDDAISELERAHQSGFKTVQLMSFPNGGAGPKPEDDRFWEKALELDMPLSPHMGFGSIPINGLRHDTSQWPPEAGMTQHAPGVPCSTMAQLIVHGVFERIPELRFYFAEINAALFPAQIYYMDRDYLEYNTWFQLELPKLPSEYMREHGMYGMVREPLAVEMGQEMPERMPLDLFWWGSDFPHSVGTFPRSQDYIKETLSGLDDDLLHTVLVGNAAKHLRLDLDADITETPAAV